MLKSPWEQAIDVLDVTTIKLSHIYTKSAHHCDSVINVFQVPARTLYFESVLGNIPHITAVVGYSS